MYKNFSKFVKGTAWKISEKYSFQLKKGRDVIYLTSQILSGTLALTNANQGYSALIYLALTTHSRPKISLALNIHM